MKALVYLTTKGINPSYDLIRLGIRICKDIELRYYVYKGAAVPCFFDDGIM